MAIYTFVRGNLLERSKYEFQRLIAHEIMVGLERTNMAIRTYATKNLLEHSKYEY